MRLRNWALAAAAMALAAILPGAALAQKPAEPTIEVRLRSVNDLLDKAEYIGGLVDKDEPVKQARGLLKQLSTEGKGIEGIDPKKPFGVYAVLTQDVQSSPVIIMIPIASQERLLAALKERLGIEPEKADGGALKMNVPLVNEVFLRFANDYLYLGRSAKDLDAKGLVSPKDFFAKDDGSVISVIARFDRIPAEVKTLVLGQFEHQVQEGLKKDEGNKSAAEKKLAALLADAVVGSSKLLAEDGKELSLKAFADAQSDEISFEITLTAKDDTLLSKTFAGLSGRTSVPAGIVAAKNPVAQIASKAGLPAEFKKRLGPVIDQAVKDAIDNAGDREAARRVIEPLAATAKAGELDFAATLAGPDAKGKYSALAAVMVKDAKDLEKVLRDFSAAIPADAAEISFDAEKIGKFAVHKAEIKVVDDNFEKIFGTKNVWLAVSDDCIAVSVEPEGTLLKAGLKAKPAGAPVFAAEIALARFVPLVEKNLKPDEVKALIKDSFGSGSPDGKDTIGISIEGGGQLKVKLKAKGKAFRLATMLDEFKLK
ncbi:MAG TPA: hypothetical protein VGL71_00100 [Urbifossiella sp.]